MAATLIKLKLRMLVNGLLREKWKLVIFGIFTLYALAGFIMSMTFTIGLAVSGELVTHGPQVLAATTLITALTFILWLIAPIIGYGFDDSLDPRRFSTLTHPSRKLGQSLIWATVFGLGSLITLAVYLPLVIVLFGAHLWLAAALTVFLLPIALYQYAVWGRALSTTLGHALVATSKGKDRTALITTVLFLAVVAPLGMWISWLGQNLTFDAVQAVAQVLLWTPLVAPVGVALAFSEGALPQLLLQVAYAAGLLLGGQWLWQRVLPVSMLGQRNPITPAAEQAITAGRHLVDESQVSSTVSKAFDLKSELPLLNVFTALPVSPATAGLAARTLQMWVKDPRLSASVFGLLVFPLLAVFMPRLAENDAQAPGFFASSSFFLYFLPFILAFTVASLPGYDSTALWGYIASGLTGWQDRAGRILGSFPVITVFLLVSVGLVAVLDTGFDPLMLGLDLFTVLLLSLAILLPLCSVWLPGIQPPGTSPLSTKGAGNQLITLLLMAVSPIGVFVFYIPVLLAYWWLAAPLVAALLGLVWASLIAGIGFWVSALVYEKQQVNLLAQIRRWPGH